MITHSAPAFSEKPSYTFACHWLYHLAYKEGLTGQEILDRSVEMMNWLTENGPIQHAWNTNRIKVPKDCTIDVPGNYSDLSYLEFSTILFFEHQSDLLAFRLRWGIQ